MPAVRIFGRRTLMGGDDVQPQALATILVRLFQITFLITPLLVHVIISVNKIGGLQNFLLQPLPLDYCNSYGGSFPKLVLTYITFSLFFSVISIILEGILYHFASRGTPTQPELRHPSVSRLLEMKLIPAALLNFIVLVLGVLTAFSAGVYYRCLHISSHEGINGGDGGGATMNEKMIPTDDWFDVMEFHWNDDYNNIGMFSYTSVTRQDVQSQQQYYNHHSHSFRTPPLWWICMVLLLTSQTAEVIFSTFALCRVLNIPKEDGRQRTGRISERVVDRETGLEEYVVLQLHHHNYYGPVEDMWEKRCRLCCRIFSRLTCFLFGGRDIAAATTTPNEQTGGVGVGVGVGDDGGGGGGEFGNIARVLADYFEDGGHLDVVPSDIVAGLIMLRRIQKERELEARRVIIEKAESMRSGGSFPGAGAAAATITTLSEGRMRKSRRSVNSSDSFPRSATTTTTTTAFLTRTTAAGGATTNVVVGEESSDFSSSFSSFLPSKRNLSDGNLTRRGFNSVSVSSGAPDDCLGSAGIIRYVDTSDSITVESEGKLLCRGDGGGKKGSGSGILEASYDKNNSSNVRKLKLNCSDEDKDDDTKYDDFHPDSFVDDNAFFVDKDGVNRRISKNMDGKLLSSSSSSAAEKKAPLPSSTSTTPISVGGDTNTLPSPMIAPCAETFALKNEATETLSRYRLHQSGSKFFYDCIDRDVLSPEDETDLFVMAEAARFVRHALGIYTWMLHVYMHPVKGPCDVIGCFCMSCFSSCVSSSSSSTTEDKNDIIGGRIGGAKGGSSKRQHPRRRRRRRSSSRQRTVLCGGGGVGGMMMPTVECDDGPSEALIDETCCLNTSSTTHAPGGEGGDIEQSGEQHNQPRHHGHHADITPVLVGDSMFHLHETALLKIAGINKSNLIYGQFENGFDKTPYCIILDHKWKSVVIAIRGSLSLEDCVVDVLVDPIHLKDLGLKFGFEGENEYCHGGVLSRVLWIYDDLQRHGLLDKLLLGETSLYPHYTLRIVGHSLGAGCAMILSLMLKRIYPKLRCLCYSPPGGLVSWNLAITCSDYVTSFVLDTELVPRLSVQNMEHLRNEVLQLILRIKVPKMRVARALVLPRICNPFDGGVDNLSDANSDMLYSTNETPRNSNFAKQIEEFNAVQQERKEHRDNISGGQEQVLLYPPGRILHLVKTSVHKKNCCIHGLLMCISCGSSNAGSKYTPVWIKNDDLNEVIISPTMGTDHFPNRICLEIEYMAHHDFGLDTTSKSLSPLFCNSASHVLP